MPGVRAVAGKITEDFVRVNDKRWVLCVSIILTTMLRETVPSSSSCVWGNWGTEKLRTFPGALVVLQHCKLSCSTGVPQSGFGACVDLTPVLFNLGCVNEHRWCSLSVLQWLRGGGGGAWRCAFLTSFQVLSMLLDLRPQLEQQALQIKAAGQTRPLCCVSTAWAKSGFYIFSWMEKIKKKNNILWPVKITLNPNFSVHQ